jgi:transcriptional regulator with XRE-family HTH domain
MAERWKETTPETSEYVRNLALGIQSELDRQGINVSVLANLSGIQASTITGLLDRELAPDLITLEHICRALDVDPKTVFLHGRTLWFEQLTQRSADRPAIFIMPFPGE